MLMWVWAIAATVAACVATVVALRKPQVKGGTWTAPSPDPGRYQVVYHFNGETRELFHGYDGLKARHAYELAPMEAGMHVEFYEWGQRRGEKKA